MRKSRRPTSVRPAVDEAADRVDDAVGDDPDEPGRPARRSARFAAALTALAVLVVGAVLVGVYPTRTWLRQERSVHGTQRDLDVLREQNQRLQEEAARLQDPAEIERLARAEYNLVRPGEEAYAILPSRQARPSTAAQPKPMAKDNAGWLSRTWHSITSIF